MLGLLPRDIESGPFLGAGVDAVVLEDGEAEEVHACVLLLVRSVGDGEGFAFGGDIAQRRVCSGQGLGGSFSATTLGTVWQRGRAVHGY